MSLKICTKCPARLVAYLLYLKLKASKQTLENSSPAPTSRLPLEGYCVPLITSPLTWTPHYYRLVLKPADMIYKPASHPASSCDFWSLLPIYPLIYSLSVLCPQSLLLYYSSPHTFTQTHTQRFVMMLTFKTIQQLFQQQCTRSTH